MADSPTPTPSSDSSGGYFNSEFEKILADTYVCFTAFVLFATFLIVITRFRLWHTNWVLQKIPDLVDNPLITLINLCLATLPVVSYKNDVYLVWMIVLLIGYDNVHTILTGSTPGSASVLSGYVHIFYAIYIGIYVNTEHQNNKYYTPLMFLWSFVLVKLSVQLVLNKLLKRAYGIHNSKLVADYMKSEHQLVTSNEVIEPKNMKGYKYLVMGEGEINVKIEGPEYMAQVELPESVITVEKVWSCSDQLLGPSVDADNRLKDICLSFAFFKLLKRRFFEYPAAEAQQEKTRRLVFEGLLTRENNHSVYRIIGMEIGFLRDLFHTRYPAAFAIGFPVLHVILLMGMIGDLLYISYIAFSAKKSAYFDYLWSEHHNINIDYWITNILVIMMIVMEAFQTMSYVFSDWAKVVLICQRIRSQKLHHRHCLLYDKVLALYCKWKFSRSLNNTIGQYSLLKNYRKSSTDRCRLNCFPYSTWGWSPEKVAPRGTRKGKAVVLSSDVKKAILESLRLTNGYPTKGVASLQRNRVYTDLARIFAQQSEFHTLIVWHIATGLCEIHPVKEGGDKKSIKPHYSVAKHLSHYCAYLMIFHPDMLSESIFSVKLFFEEILSETKGFFHKTRSSVDQYNLMMQVEDSGGNRVIDIAVRLGKYLMQIPDDVQRWKIMADFWSEFIIFLAPSGKVGEHLKMLESGGEFITHLWALLYHAGIVDHTTVANSVYYS